MSLFYATYLFAASASAPIYPTYGIGSKHHTTTRKERLTFQHVNTAIKAGDVRVSTYMSPAMPLKPGEVVFTDPAKTPLEMPTGRVAVLGFEAEVVDANNASVPLDEVYNHHWLVFDGRGNAGVCDNYLSYKFGVGAESRNSPVRFPEGYGVVLDGTETWGANIHLLRTVDLEGGDDKVKNCIECVYAPDRGCTEAQTGTFACCGDGSFCKASGRLQQPRDFYLRYNVTWVPTTSNSTGTHSLSSENDSGSARAAVAASSAGTGEVQPLSIYVFDASNCAIEYNVGAAYKKSRSKDVQLCWHVPGRARVAYAIGHQHIGGINITLAKRPKTGAGGVGAPLETLCTSYPTYGRTATGAGRAGDEKGYLVKMSACEDLTDKTVDEGDEICVISHYDTDASDTRSAPIPGGAHGGVMSLFYVAAVEY